MSSMTKLADLLTTHMKDRRLGPSRLAEQANRFAGTNLVNRRSIENWRDGLAGSVRDWRQLVVLAAALGLVEAQTDELLESAGLPRLDILRRQASSSEAHLLAPWSTAIPGRQTSSTLQWESLRQAAAAVTEAEFGALGDRFRSDLYVQRHELLRDFLTFIGSDKTAFVLTGHSGVGKSSFLLALVESSSIASDMAICLYNGARLSAGVDLYAKVGTDLARKMRYTISESEDIFTAIEQANLMRERTLIVAFDAINENLAAPALLMKIDQLVGKVAVSWLKVVITSRPEAWRTAKRGIPLADHRYYRTKEHATFGTSPDVVLEPFQYDELREAYEKYRAVYGLVADFDQLPVAFRSALRDPLLLGLVGEGFRRRQVPTEFAPSDMVRLFIQGLLQTGRLFEDDLDFLENELMPLMIDGGNYRNRINAQQIRRASAAATSIRYNRSSGLVAASSAKPYARLVDAGILEEQGSPDDHEVSFKHERLFDFYAGRRIRSLLDRSGRDRTTTLQGYITPLSTHPFLWGALQNVLISEFQQGDLTTIGNLAQGQDDIVKQLLVETLVEHGMHDPQSVRRVLEDLLQRPTSRRVVERPAIRAQHDAVVGSQRAKQVAIEVAAKLAIPEVFVTATCDPSAFVRNHALLFLQIMSQHAPEAAVEVIGSLASRASTKFGVPRPRTLESLIGASTLVSAGLTKQPTKLASVQTALQQVIDRYLGIRSGHYGVRSQFNASMRRALLLFATHTMTRVLQMTVPPSSSVNFRELGSFVRQNEEARSRFKRLLPFLDPEHGPWQDAFEDMAALYDCRDLLTTELLAMLILSGWGRSRLTETMGYAESLFELSLSLQRPGPMAAGVIGAVCNWFRNDSSTDTIVLDTLHQFYWQYYRKSYGMSWSNEAEYWHSSFDRLIIANYRITGSIFPRGVQDELLAGTAAGDFNLHRLLLGVPQGSSMALGALDFMATQGHSGLALEIAGYLARFPEPQVHDLLYRFLARMRLRDSRTVEDFADFHGLSMGKVRAAEANISARDIADISILATSPIISGMQDYPAFYREVRRMLFQLADCTTVSQIVQCFVRRMASLVYGAPVLDRPGDLPF